MNKAQEAFSRRLKEKCSELTKAQRRVGDYLLEHLEEVAYTSAAKLGQQAGVSESSVLRLLSSLGYDGFAAFQKAVQKNLTTPLTLERLAQTATHVSPESTVWERSFALDRDNLNGALAQVAPADFERAVTYLTTARHVRIIGLRSSYAAAYFLAFTLNAVRGNARVLTPGTGDLAEDLRALGPEDCVVGIAFPRYTRDTVRVLQFARAHGAHTIALTDGVSSPLAPLAEVSFFFPNASLHPIGSAVPAVALANALVSAVALAQEKEVVGALTAAEEAFDQLETFVR
ncbi:MAG TPA: MurR/RpiR family transcriptional regulator [Firmicutes bacterium]|nr:MurR/RpiR family transcriptional regulator [Bacillota bacterium]